MLIETHDGKMVNLSHVWLIQPGVRNDSWHVEALMNNNYPSGDPRKAVLVMRCTEEEAEAVISRIFAAAKRGDTAYSVKT